MGSFITHPDNGVGMEMKCGHCHQTYEHGKGHDCTPNCLHCGATYDDLQDPKYESPKIAVSRHQRECSERPEGWGENLPDPEAEFRERRREDKRIREWERKRLKRGHVW